MNTKTIANIDLINKNSFSLSNNNNNNNGVYYIILSVRF